MANTSRGLDLLARLGFASKGVLYATVGVLAFQAAAGIGGGRITDSDGALIAILRQPFGRTLLLVLAIGLFGYAVWRTLQGLVDSEDRGSDLKGIALRTSFVARGALHAYVGWKVFQLYRGLSVGRNAEDRIVAATFAWPLGDWLVVLVGLGLLGYAAYQIFRAVKTKLGRHFDIERMRRDLGEWAVMASRAGLAARGVVFGIIAWYLIQAGMTRRASDTAGTAEAIRVVANWQEPVGSWMLAIIGAGLVAYGAFQMLNARYREIRT